MNQEMTGSVCPLDLVRLGQSLSLDAIAARVREVKIVPARA